ncbi:MAG: hypothetical protein A3I29_04390 [Candidatus Magasanikbacteria bacterium RIFCSPLOWO2_02_FULL_44_11]|uniref:Transcription regulator TrmB N-terminal domain-containing protein n=1 Tax=Candidatus Magasanikbacteria bacterium RIFCSPLOWO2_02_FULL_44_11 TaxID=1798689 RepID=A0A1F6NB80_9BACT|nr:MAG: hypothetical protein A3I29_04390 [Candidatus Magasanikbacteria bacterium RIFCSPLOWO2_02_FULL_44_11]
MNTKELLQQIGLSDKEAQIFITTHELGLGTAYEIAKRSKIKRTTTYAVLDQLEQKKFVSSVVKKDKKIYIPLQPQALIDRATEKISEAKQQETYLHQLVPLLEALANRSPHKPNIIYYQDRDGVRDLHNEMLRNITDKNMYYLTAVENIEQVVGKTFFTNWIQRRINQGIKSTGIRNKTKEVANTAYTNKSDYLRDYRFAPSWVNLPLGLYICGNKVAIMSSQKESFGILIESQEFAVLMKSLFDALWKLCDPV